MKKEMYYRILFYICGLFILALGLTLNTKSGLGVSAIISIPYSLSEILGYNFGDMTLVFYCLFVFVQMIIHFFTKKDDSRLILLADFLQIPLSIVFTRILNILAIFLPDVSSDNQMILRLIILAGAIVCTGIGASLSLSMRFVPNPGDGIVQALADCSGNSVGITKNCFDLFSIIVTTCLGFLLMGHIVGIGLGTVLAVVGVGRIIAIFQHFTQDKINALSGL